MMLALMLAQLVLPWPGLDSPLVQPGPTICVGECAGPVIYGAAERGRLVVACDMRSDTCSDGRKITTTRSTPVPCEVSPGVWEMVGVDEGCYSVRGLEAWAANTSYLAWGGDLTKEVWEPRLGSTIEVLPDGYRIHPGAGVENSGHRQVGIEPAVGEETRTLTCLVRTYAPAYIRYWLGNSVSASFSSVDTGGKWQVLSATRTLRDGDGTFVRIGNGPATEDPVPFDVAGCWLTKSNTPGRACWGGEAPVTCARDRHTISTEGWPTESGEISVAFVAGVPTAQQNRTLIDGQAGSSCRFWITSSGSLQITNCPGWPLSLTATTVSIQEGRPYVATFKRRAGKASIWLDGVMQVEGERPPFVWDPSVDLGTTGTQNHLNGPIRSLRVRSFE